MAEISVTVPGYAYAVQIGNYVIYSKAAKVTPYFVKMAGDEMPLSTHWSRADARAAVKRYAAADARRSR